MDDLPDELRERVRRLNADLLFERVRPGEAVLLAWDLLGAGVESPAVLELAGESPTVLTRAEGVPLVRQMLVDLGVALIDRSQAPWVIARDVARQMVAGDLPPEDGASLLWGLWESCDNAQEIGRMIQPLDAWFETLPALRNDEAIRTEMRTLAQGIVRAANARLEPPRV